MSKVLILFLLWTVCLYAEAFKETRYMYALDATFTYEGTITFADDKVLIAYTHPRQEVIEYLKNDADMRKATFFLILQAIHGENEDLLEQLFMRTQKKEHRVFLPREPIDDVIREIEVTKDQQGVHVIKISLQNDDWIRIETIR